METHITRIATVVSLLFSLSSKLYFNGVLKATSQEQPQETTSTLNFMCFVSWEFYGSDAGGNKSALFSSPAPPLVSPPLQPASPLSPPYISFTHQNSVPRSLLFRSAFLGPDLDPKPRRGIGIFSPEHEFGPLRRFIEQVACTLEPGTQREKRPWTGS